VLIVVVCLQNVKLVNQKKIVQTALGMNVAVGIPSKTKPENSFIEFTLSVFFLHRQSYDAL
jgi:hypothetical protein